jgi:peptidoglycan L-alanyl-D-glutamate endopeptidase CwlK
MIDNLSLSRLKLLHPIIREQAIDIYTNKIVPALTGEYFCRVAYTYRSFEEQDLLYAQGRTKLFDNNGKRLGIVTQAKGGLSFHQYGLALDIVLVSGKTASWDITKDWDKDGKSDWLEAIDKFRLAGWEWGGNWKFKDYPHVQFPVKYTIKELLKKYEKGDTFVDNENGIKYVNL